MTPHLELADAHVHFFPQGYRRASGVALPDGRELTLYEELREVHRIGDVLAVGYEGEPAYRGNNRYLAELCAQRPWLHPLAYFDAEAPPTAETLVRLRGEGFFGISLYLSDPSRAEAFTRWPEAVLALLNRQRAIISLNLPCRHLPVVSQFLEKLRHCRVLISHLGLPTQRPGVRLEEELQPLAELARLPNLGVKASAFYAYGGAGQDASHRGIEAVLEILLRAFGFERLYWGSDFSPALEFVSFEQTIDVLLASPQLGETERAAILGGNLRRLLTESPAQPC